MRQVGYLQELYRDVRPKKHTHTHSKIILNIKTTELTHFTLNTEEYLFNRTFNCFCYHKKQYSAIHIHFLSQLCSFMETASDGIVAIRYLYQPRSLSQN